MREADIPSVDALKVIDGDTHQGTANVLWCYECECIGLYFIHSDGSVEDVFGHESIDDFVGVAGDFAVLSDDYEKAMAYSAAFEDYWANHSDGEFEGFDDFILQNPINVQ